MKLLAFIAASCLAAGCAATPPAGFPVELPETLDPDRRAIAVIGDLQMSPWYVRWPMRRENNRDAQKFLMDDLESHIDELGALVIVGDLVFTGRSKSDWRHFDVLAAPFAERMPVLPAIGNHDYHCRFVQFCDYSSVPSEFLERFPWFEPGRPYLVRYGDVALVFLDSELELDAQGAWLAEQIDSLGGQVSALLVLTHRPPFTDSSGRSFRQHASLHDHIVLALDESSPTTIFISGHAHGYEHMEIEGMHYIVTAGGGGPRMPLIADRPSDVYTGPECEPKPGVELRPFNYLLVERVDTGLAVTARGFCKNDSEVGVIEAFELPLNGR